MSVVTTTRAVRSDRGDVRVQVEDGDVQITWYCGDSRHFTPQAVKNVLTHLKTAAEYRDAHLRIEDKYGDSTDLRVLEGKLFVNGSDEFVDLGDLRRAIKLTLKGEK